MSDIYMEYLTESEREELIQEKERQINDLNEEMKNLFISYEGTKSIDKKAILKYHFLDTYESKYDNMYNQRCDAWDKGIKVTKSYNIDGFAEFYYVGYTLDDIKKIAKNNINKIYNNMYDFDKEKMIIDPKFDGKSLGSVFENGGGDCILYCPEDDKFYIYLHEEARPIVAGMSFKEFMNISKSEVMNNPIYKKRYNEKNKK